jgi:hypothetical protein
VGAKKNATASDQPRDRTRTGVPILGKLSIVNGRTAPDATVEALASVGVPDTERLMVLFESADEATTYRSTVTESMGQRTLSSSKNM